uniref:Uncharacterized protein n=1 Tax=Anguilla anguilla TaxID=7936 RepID=A0A0E9RLM9_ANGAN
MHLLVVCILQCCLYSITVVLMLINPNNELQKPSIKNRY